MTDEQSTPEEEQKSDPAFDAFLARVLERPLPQNPMQRVRTLAKELAEGAAVGHWRMYLYTFRGQLTGDQENTLTYMDKRWGENFPSLDLLMGNQYLQPYSPNSD